MNAGLPQNWKSGKLRNHLGNQEDQDILQNFLKN